MTHVYPFKEANPIGPARTEMSYNEDLKTKNNENGVVGTYCLSFLEYFHPISGTCIDYMHSLLEGVVKSMFSKWFGQENHQMICSLRNYMQQIDQRVINIRPPKYIPTTPRSIYSWKTWSAHEYLSFILYYALPVFVDIMEADLLRHIIWPIG